MSSELGELCQPERASTADSSCPPSDGKETSPAPALPRIRIRRTQSSDRPPEAPPCLPIGQTVSATAADAKRPRDIFKADTDSDSDTDSDESGDTAEREKRRRRRRRRRQATQPSSKRLPRHVVKVLKRWMLSPEHYDYPYPDEENKAKLMEVTGICVKQLNTWFTNARKRIWAPRRRKRGEPIPEYIPPVETQHVTVHDASMPGLRSAAPRASRPPAGFKSEDSSVVVDALSLLAIHATTNHVDDGGDGWVRDPFEVVYPDVPTPLLGPKPPLDPHASLSALTLPGRPPRITKPPPLVPKGEGGGAGIPLPPPPLSGFGRHIGGVPVDLTPADASDLPGSAVGDSSPFSMFRLSDTGTGLLLLTTPEAALLDDGVDEDCMSEEDAAPPDDELGPATLGSLVSADSGPVGANGTRGGGGRFSARVPSETDALLSEYSLFNVDLTPSVLAQHNRAQYRR